MLDAFASSFLLIVSLCDPDNTKWNVAGNEWIYKCLEHPV